MPQSPNKCSVCDELGCDGQLNRLRSFRNWDDLSAHASEEKLVEWVNKHAKIVEQRRIAQRKVIAKQKAMEQALEEAVGDRV